MEKFSGSSFTVLIILVLGNTVANFDLCYNISHFENSFQILSCKKTLINEKKMKRRER